MEKDSRDFKDLLSIQKQRHILTSHLEHSENAVEQRVRGFVFKSSTTEICSPMH